MAGKTDAQLMLQVDASVELARRNLNSLEASVAKNAKKMDADLGRIESANARAAASFKGLAVTAGSFLAGIGIAGIVSLGRGVLEFADTLDAAAQQAGVSVERYQTLQEGLRALEVDTAQVDKSLKALTDTLGQVQSGTAGKGVVETLEKMGIKTRILSGEITTADQLLDAIAASAGKFKSEAEFTAAVVDILGRKVGVDMANALKDGGAALHKIEEQMRSTGDVISKEMVAKLADANEAIDAFQTRASRQFVIFAANAIGSMDELLNKANRLGLVLAKLSPFGNPGAFQTEIDAYDRRSTTASAVQAQRARVASALAARNASLTNGSPIPKQGQLLENARKEVAELNRLRGIFAENNPRRAQVTLPRTTFDPPESGGGSARGGGGSSGAAKRIREIKEEADLAIPSISAMAMELAKLDIVDPQKAANDNARSFYSNLGIDPDEYKNVIAASEARREREYEVNQEIAEDYREKMESQVRTLANLYEEAFRGGTGSIWKTFKDMGIRVVAEVLAKFTAAQLNGGGFNLGSALTSSLGGLFGGAFAGGGSPPVGRISLVGEKGPELFMPKVPGVIIPNHALKAAANDQMVVNITIAPNIAGNAMTHEDGMRLAAMTKQAAISGVKDAMSRRGSWR